MSTILVKCRDWLPWIKVMVSVALVWLVLRLASLDELAAAYHSIVARWPYLVISVALVGLTVFAAIWRWRVLLATFGRRIRWSDLLGALLVGSFFNQFLPSTIGGDVVRGWWIREDLDSATQSVTIVALDRFFGVLGMCALGIVAAVVEPDIVARLPEFWVVEILVGLGCVVLLALLRPESVAFARRVLASPIFGRLREKAMIVYRGLKVMMHARGALAGAFFLSVLIQCFIVAQYLVFSFALALSINVWELAILVMVVTLVTWLPLTINGIGLRELTLATLGGALGLQTADAIALGWLFVLFSWPVSLAGGAVYLMSGRGGPPSARRDATPQVGRLPR